MIDLQQFKKNALARGLCENYTSMWSDEKGKRQLFELACDVNSIKYMAKSLSEGWGLSPVFISDKFKAYIMVNIYVSMRIKKEVAIQVQCFVIMTKMSFM